MLSADKITPGLYRHYKGNLYEVIGVASHSETEESLVVYRALYGARGMWVRPFDMFTSDVEVDGRRMRRFAPVDEPGRGNRASDNRASSNPEASNRGSSDGASGHRGSMDA
jgi:hypothetical protein